MAQSSDIENRRMRLESSTDDGVLPEGVTEADYDRFAAAIVRMLAAWCKRHGTELPESDTEKADEPEPVPFSQRRRRRR
jgi:hypothetical protein